MIIIYFWVDESPKWLYEESKFKECHDIMQKIAKINGKPKLPSGGALKNATRTQR